MAAGYIFHIRLSIEQLSFLPRTCLPDNKASRDVRVSRTRFFTLCYIYLIKHAVNISEGVGGGGGFPPDLSLHLCAGSAILKLDIKHEKAQPS